MHCEFIFSYEYMGLFLPSFSILGSSLSALYRALVSAEHPSFRAVRTAQRSDTKAGTIGIKMPRRTIFGGASFLIQTNYLKTIIMRMVL